MQKARAYGFTGLTRQISSAYCWIVRSLENLPMRATFRIDFLVHAAGSRYVFDTCSWHAMYDA